MLRRNYIIFVLTVLMAVFLLVEMATGILSLDTVIIILLPALVTIMVLAAKKEPASEKELLRLIKDQQSMLRKIKGRKKDEIRNRGNIIYSKGK